VASLVTVNLKDDIRSSAGLGFRLDFMLAQVNFSLD
jgi:hypothetical protein